MILINAIQILQNRVVRLITYNDDFPLIPGPLPASNPIFYKLELLKIKELFILMSCTFIYKCLNTSLLPLFEGWLTRKELTSKLFSIVFGRGHNSGK